MSINPILSTSVYTERPSSIDDPRLRVNEGNSCWSTAAKIATVIAAIGASIAGFVILGPLVGFVAALASGTVAYLLFSNNTHHHSNNQHRHDVGYVPLFQRVVSYFPSFNNWFPSGVYRMNDEHVPVGRGRGGNGRGGNIVVGGSHGPGHPAQSPSGPQNHVPRGGGRTGSAPQGRGVPPPSGPGGHVDPGAGHFRFG
jgi:hypothetical protein